MLSKRVSKKKGSPNMLHSAWYKQNRNPYNEKTNPKGIINLGTAENRIVYDVVKEKMNSVKASDIPEKYTHYCKLSGTDEFRDKLNTFFTNNFKPSVKLQRDDIYVMNGCGTVIEALGYSLCDEGDGVLIPAPYYCGFESDLEQRIGVKTYPVHLESKSLHQVKPFQLTTQLLEEAFIKAEEEGIHIKALLLSNPNNPLGIIYTEEELESYITFCSQYNIHLICDEIYMMSVYDENVDFKSVLSLKSYLKHSDKIHVVWGFSKDFGLSGFRCGIAITKNVDLQSALTSVGYYTSVPTATQYILEELITDETWLNKLKSINHSRLRKSRDLVTQHLQKWDIPYIYPTSGLFLWMNLSNYLLSDDKQAEVDMFNKLMNHGLYLVPGFAFECIEHGWFRIIIAHELDILQTGLARLKDVCIQNNNISPVILTGNKRSLTSNEFFLNKKIKQKNYLTDINGNRI
ncbi:probable inactive 1-aminocyclopropane-1-carboxylate synthase-like protein 2 [Hydractinia symbiolongicarpus]|uniref:probable inactive 1-aminocyclopropane-1-carboxylate synthase-like protein 2 n=1 Tax=Hydractinia symbiolongicarpus TaxID=13093 RepID=UPI00254F5A55|nr:probable inactive 1-aminocyclopropane-1-carboxylate synthase-like protein 2 [Hydractinia symbiolongicarpus]